jgi:demethylmacrocin O-methyltransferase
MEMLKEIFNRHDTDKERVHCYASKFYDKEFEKYRDKPISLLEIGTLLGQSALSWADYFHNAERILTVDIRPIPSDRPKSNRVEYIVANGYDLSLANKLGRFDIIVEDGLHTLQTQAETIKIYSHYLKSGGVLVIEDIPQQEWISVFEDIVNGFGDEFSYGTVITGSNRDDRIFYVRKK